MIDNLVEDIQEHLAMLDLAVKSSEQIKNYAQNEDINGIVSETENRERIVNIVTQLQKRVEEKINLIDASDVQPDDINILKSWFNDLNLCSEKMLDLDRETVELLSQQKDNTTKEIALIFKNKELFKGYNHAIKK